MLTIWSLADRLSSDVSRLRLDVCDVSLVASQQPGSTKRLGNDRGLSTETRNSTSRPPFPSSDPRDAGPQHLSSRLPSNMSIEKGSFGNADCKVQPLRRSSTEVEVLPQFPNPFTESGLQPAIADQKCSHIRVEASVSSVSYQRDRLCLCQCHHVTTMASPGDWSNVLGRLFVGYTGLPLPTKKCDRKSCEHGQVQTRIRVAYLFPFWFAWRSFALTVTKASTSFMWKLDFPAVTQGSSDMFVHASLGNTEKIQGMLSKDAGSFNVIDSVANKSTLHVRL